MQKHLDLQAGWCDVFHKFNVQLFHLLGRGNLQRDFNVSF